MLIAIPARVYSSSVLEYIYEMSSGPYLRLKPGMLLKSDESNTVAFAKKVVFLALWNVPIVSSSTTPTHTQIPRLSLHNIVKLYVQTKCSISLKILCEENLHWKQIRLLLSRRLSCNIICLCMGYQDYIHNIAHPLSSFWNAIQWVQMSLVLTKHFHVSVRIIA